MKRKPGGELESPFANSSDKLPVRAFEQKAKIARRHAHVRPDLDRKQSMPCRLGDAVEMLTTKPHERPKLEVAQLEAELHQV